ncbi:DUF3084 domain-containing protein [Plectonema cf. radiosum LEGE 06105]|uniref:DUF3084 domain-containing protein n=1 Tax=Plectonema cf. radiosum LEGE 06105 TaxID=945769 RepID=A0A8J7F024_9CYAN|nr:DUF3084 domain-containing protein [Plectonema radiosum]MBE9213208.1 DUF3084 domain-containing protein [Plectonema cf. radiosum LEGE 06105]
MTTVYIILAILITGGIISTLGDRVKRKIRKERLSLFNLRPKHTISLVAMLTGMSISASTLLILFVADKDLRRTVFKPEQIHREIQSKQQELKLVTQPQLEIKEIGKS